MECIYCSSPLIEGKKVRCRSSEIIGKEIEMAVKENSIKKFFFVDSIFNIPEEHAKKSL